jgi:hypothetical protein
MPERVASIILPLKAPAYWDDNVTITNAFLKALSSFVETFFSFAQQKELLREKWLVI